MMTIYVTETQNFGSSSEKERIMCASIGKIINALHDLVLKKALLY